MQLDLHISRFDWAGGSSGIGPGVAALATRAEAVGVRALSFMDHFFQMDWMAPAEHPMLEGYTALGFIAGKTETLTLHVDEEYLRFNEVAAYTTSLVLAALAVATLVLMNVFKPKEYKEVADVDRRPPGHQAV